MPDAQIGLMVLQEDRAADANPSRMAALPAYRDGKAMPKAFANPMGLNDRLAVGGFGPWTRGCGGGGNGKTGPRREGWAQTLPRIGLCEVGIVGRLPAPGRLTRRLSGLRAKCDRPNLACRRARSLRLRKLPTRRHAKAALGGASLRLLRVSLFGAGQGLWPRDRRRTWFS